MARKYEAIATASTIITDETDASYLTGNLTVVNSSRNQIYYTGQSNPYSPDWSNTNLVIRPYLLATNIYKTGDSGRYNPDLAKEGKNPMQLDSKEPDWSKYNDFLMGEGRYAQLAKVNPEKAQELYESNLKDAQKRYSNYVYLAQKEYPNK